jgi:hypothetical protein
MIPWPELDFYQLKPTLETMHLWTQIIGKIRLRQMPWINHSWHVTLYVSSSGLNTGSIPYARGIFQIDIDIIRNLVVVNTSEAQMVTVDLYPRSVASFYKELMLKFAQLDIPVEIYPKPNEMAATTPFDEDHAQRVYDPDQMMKFWQALIRAHVLFTRFRAMFNGKVSPVHFFWGSFDLAVTRFSGRKAPLYPGGSPNIPDAVMQEAYSHEVSSCGFWPGSEAFPYPMFYSYCYPRTEEFDKQPVEPRNAFFSHELGEYVLPYHVVQQAADPDALLLSFLQSTFTAAAVAGNWKRDMECDLTSFQHG